ncbi:WG repeat-containing protein [Fusibacter sp. 3D3]|uniref:WG repeat-containing protein n=1 Tax=Fusibacter sp. 3D3 TaxID=1048380 RepID=UPI0008528E00|nr:WG repeat-containing protein [Fusibacter sp. 3D3]GAU77391.1 hypothetical protein F3D3_2018 [Fusibacter sp. 3D3]
MKAKIKSMFKVVIVLQIVSMMIFGSFLSQPLFAASEGIHVVENEVFDRVTLMSASEGRILFSDDAGYGYLDYEGHIVIPAQFEEAEAFNSGIARVTTAEGVAYIDSLGKTVFTLKALATELDVNIEDFYIYEFSNGLAMVDNYESIGYINTTGKMVIPFGTYYDGNVFGNPLALVYNDDYDHFFIKADGSKAFETKADYDYYAFSSGRAVVYDSASSQYGYVDELGKLVVPFTLDDAFDYIGDIAIFEEDGRYGVLNKKGTVIIKPTFKSAQISDDGYLIGDDGFFTMILSDQMKPIGKFLSDLNPDFYENLYVEDEGIHYVFKDFSGNALTTCTEYAYLGDHIFSVDGGKIIDTHDVKANPTQANAFNVNVDYDFKFVDNTGKVVLDLSDYDSVEPFSEGRAVVEKDGKYGYIDKTGTVVISIQYESAGNFSAGKASVYHNDNSYTLDLNGNIISDEDDYGNGNSNPAFYTISKEGDGYVGIASTETDQIVLQPKYSSIEDMGNDVFLLESDGLYGYYDAQKNRLVDPAYEDMAIFPTDNVIIAESKAHLYGMTDLSGNVLVESKYEYISALDNGLYEISDENQLSGVVDHKGNVIVDAAYDYVEAYVTDQVLVLGLEKGIVYSTLIYDMKRKTVINRNLSGYPMALGDHSVVLESEDGEVNVVGFNGNVIYRTTDVFVETYGDYHQFMDEHDVYYIVDKAGKTYLENNTFDDLYLPVDSDHMIFMEADKFGIVALDGTVKTKALYSQVSYLNDGVMAVLDNGQFGYIHVDGQYIVKLGEYDYLYNFTDGLGLVIKVND